MKQAWELSKRTVQAFLKDNCMDMAATIAYYTLFSLFPLVLGLLAILGLFLDQAPLQRRLLEMASQVFPASSELIAQSIEGVVAARGAVGVIAVIGLLWSGTGMFSAISTALNRAWKVERARAFVKQKLLELGMVAGVGLLFLASLAATTFFRFVWQLLPHELQRMQGGFAWNAATGLLPAAASFGMFALLYRVIPNTRVSWRDVWPGALLAATLFEAGKNIFAWYLAEFANYPLVYGSLGAVIALLFWTYISALILLLGAELAAESFRLRNPRDHMAGMKIGFQPPP